MTDLPIGGRIVLVGHCGGDSFFLKRAIKRLVPEATIDEANQMEALASYLDGGNVLLVNRVVDGRFDTGDGVDLIETICRQGTPAKLILISDYDDAQTRAVAVGAMPGFGKSDLDTPRTGSILRVALGLETPPPVASEAKSGD